jgi:arginine/ornithine N-succinyltransferase beta subunit
MSFMIRPARLLDIEPLAALASSLSARGFLTLPERPDELEKLIALSEQSFRGGLKNPDQGRYVFVMEDMDKRRVRRLRRLGPVQVGRWDPEDDCDCWGGRPGQEGVRERDSARARGGGSRCSVAT